MSNNLKEEIGLSLADVKEYDRTVEGFHDFKVWIGLPYGDNSQVQVVVEDPLDRKEPFFLISINKAVDELVVSFFGLEIVDIIRDSHSGCLGVRLKKKK
jgi:hypothetical protein